MKKRDVYIWLSSIQGVSYGAVRKLEEYFGDIEEVWEAEGRDIYRALGKRSKSAVKIANLRSKEYWHKTREKLSALQVSTVTIADGNYPGKLKKIYDPPYVLFYKGELPGDRPTIGMVGARNATPYGKWAAKKFAKELTDRGVGVISGLALGIDTESHKGAVENRGYTLGVLGSGVDVAYPPTNHQLMENIQKQGCILSEFFLGEEPLKHHFPQRNRIISGLSDGIVVIEAGEKSGSLITVEYALEQGRDVFALPGNINCEKSRGTNRLIRDGAKVLVEVEDILAELPEGLSLPIKQQEEDILRDLSDSEVLVYRCLEKRPLDLDALYYRTKIDIQSLNILLTSLELKGYITRMPGKSFTVNR
ncbi:DNA-processing protein DprA [Isachenkonia alkalipeptolytica]|uniref:DNA-protecting protein DprA n=1 Tax=Isachenkonia alkalipeptolytica TaxID=2565777 RepID=A0AA43XJL1_9CLOT|nr:DNA-processing protein DprA [Isachenkonia alkalipeptolytica]NBG87556.1 DNA-protecting protein DprA [Isachenkonia alkalipeptolytica]